MMIESYSQAYQPSCRLQCDDEVIVRGNKAQHFPPRSFEWRILTFLEICLRCASCLNQAIPTFGSTWKPRACEEALLRGSFPSRYVELSAIQSARSGADTGSFRRKSLLNTNIYHVSRIHGLLRIQCLLTSAVHWYLRYQRSFYGSGIVCQRMALGFHHSASVWRTEPDMGSDGVRSVEMNVLSLHHRSY